MMKRQFLLLFVALLLATLSSWATTTTVKLYSAQATAAKVGGIATSTEHFVGTGAWKNDQAASEGKMELYLPLTSLGSFTIDDISSLKFSTKKVSGTPNDVDFFWSIYTDPYTGGFASWYGQRLTSEPMYYNGYNAPYNVWSTFQTGGSINQMTFFDSNHSWAGYSGAPTLTDIQSSSIEFNKGATPPYWVAGSGIDYGAQKVKYISLATGSASNATMVSYLDNIIIELNNGDKLIVDLEEKDPAPITSLAPTSSVCGILDIPVTVKDFKEVGAITLTLNYDPSVLAYQSVSLNPSLTGATTSGASGQFILGSFPETAITLADDATLFTLHFNLLASAVSGASTSLTWSTASGENEYAGPGGNPVYTSTFNSQTLTIPARPVKNIETGLEYCTIQAALDAAETVDGNHITVAAGTYPEQVTISKSIHLTSSVGAIIQAPSTLPVAADPLSSIVIIKGSGVNAEINGFTVQGPGPTGCGSMGRGIFVRDGAFANIHDNQILDIRDNPFSGCQNGIAIQVGRNAWSTSGTATIANNIIMGYQKGAIVVDNAGSSATISGNTITGAGTTNVTAQNGVQISRGATATISGNTISGNSFHLNGNASDWGACGILLYQSGAVALTGGNIISGNDQNYNASGVIGNISLGAETFGASAAPVTKGYQIGIDGNYNIDASNCTFEAISPSTATLTQLFAIEDRIWHSVDDPTKTGFVKVKAGNVYVTPTETDAHIQNGIDAAVAGDMVNVQAGDYGIETAANRSVYGNGPHQFGLYIDKNNLTVRGYKSGDVPIDNASEAAVVFKTGSTANFGPDGIFVQGNGVTLEGLKIGDNIVAGAVSSNKTVDVIGDAFTMNKCFINTSSDEGALYFSNWDAPALPIVKYSITNNIFNNAVVSINSGAGATGIVSDRIITGNTFTGVATPYLIGFRGWNGANPAQGWILQPVGGAVVTGNIFNNTGVINYIIARGNAGGYDNSQLNWKEMWTANTYGNHVVTLENEATFAVRSYDDGASPKSYPETRRISPKIQENVIIGQTGDVVLVSDGTYVENVVVTKNISLLSVNGAASTIIDGVNTGNELAAIQLEAGRDGVRIGSIGHGFNIKGIDGPAGVEKAAIYLQGAQSNITIEDNIIEARGDAALQGEWNAANDHVTINKNVITGQTFNGAVPATGDQFTVPNVARQAVAFGGGTSTTNTGNFIFTNNAISAITGITTIGNGLVTLDLVGINDISGNTFTGQAGPTAWRPALRLRGSGTHTIKKNSFTGNFSLALERQGTTVDASENWWGDASGPYNDPQNKCGLGKAVTANVTFMPWYTDAAMTTLSTTPAGPVVDVVIPISSTVECESSAVVPTLPVVKDYCGTALTPAGPVMSGTYAGCEGTKIYTYTYTDALGQQLVWAYTYNIVRTTLPSEFGGPVSTTGGKVECASAATAPTILPLVKDVCGVVIPTPTPVISSVSCEGTKTFTYTYVDCAGKQFVWTYSYTIDHTTAPVVPAAGSSTVACESMAIPPLAIEAAVDQQQLAFGGSFSNNTATGQSFTCGIGGLLTQIDVNVNAISAGPAPSISIYSGNGPFGTPIYTGACNLPGTGWQTINIPQNVAPDLVAGVQYTFWISGYELNTVQLGGNLGGYSSGVAWDNCNGCTPPNYVIVPMNDVDLMFKTYMKTVSTVTDVCGNVIPTPTPVVTGPNGCAGTKVYTYTYTDCSGLSTDWVYTYTIAPPALVMPTPGSSTVSCPSASQIAPTVPPVLDGCGNTVNGVLVGHDPAPNCNGDVVWTYSYTACNSVVSNWTYTYHVVYSGGLTVPALGASTVAGPAQAVNPGAPANITDACGRTVVPVLVGSSTPPACEGQVVWTYRYTACDGTTTADWTYTYTVTKSILSGTMKYNNASKTPMGNVTLALNPGNFTATTDASGAYSFPNLCPGTYTLTVTNNNKDIGGFNATDAAQVNAWTVNFGSIDQVKFMAGDGSNDNFLTPQDAQMIVLRYVKKLPFTRDIWSYWKKVSAPILANDNPYLAGDPSKPWPTAITVEVSGNVPDFDLYAMCTGDYNGSLVPDPLKSAIWNMELNTNNMMNAVANQEFELPIRAASAMKVGAISMTLEIPASLVNVQDVRVNGSTDPVVWAVNGNLMTLGWYSSTPVNVAENGNLITLKLKTTNAFTTGQTMDIALKFDPLNELADGNFDVIQDATLLIAQVGNGLTSINPKDAQSLSLSNYPNPFKGSTTVDYQLPVNGKVTINVYNQIGQLVKTLVDGNQNAGDYSIRMDANNLMPGIYIAKLSLTNTGVDLSGTLKLSVLK